MATDDKWGRIAQQLARSDPPVRPTAEVFVEFLRLGLTSFGGPIAHLACFRTEFIDRRQWLGDAPFTQLLALCQVLPGPARSQLGFAIGMLRAGWPGAITAFVGFTLPSALLLGLLAAAAGGTDGGRAARTGTRLVHGLELTAVIVVAHAVLRMAATMAIGARWVRDASAAHADAVPLRFGRRVGSGAILLFAIGPCAATAWPAVGAPGIGTLAAAFWRAGSLVFGGGHVVLLLLVFALPAWSRLQAMPRAAGALAGVNAAVVGPLAAAWYDPVTTSGIRSTADAVVAVIGLALLLRAPRTVPWIAVGCLGASFALG
jgi:chromate transporter